MRKYYIKLITGFRDDQFITIPMQEAHKAYYLFRNPDQRGVFENGLAIVGSAIREIHPDWNATMGYNPDHKLDADDFNQINGEGVSENMSLLLEKAKKVSDVIVEKPYLMKLQLKEILNFPEFQKLETNETVKLLSENFKVES